MEEDKMHKGHVHEEMESHTEVSHEMEHEHGKMEGHKHPTRSTIK